LSRSRVPEASAKLSGKFRRDDTNGDGITNGMAWVLGAADPDADARGLLPEIDNEDPEFFIFTYSRSDEAAAAQGITIEVEYDNDLIAPWTTAVDDGTNILIEETDNFYGVNPGVDRVDVKIRRSFAGARLFARLKVAAAP